MRLTLFSMVLLVAMGSEQADAAGDLDAPIARGRYLAQQADCAACHTADPKRPFAGGLALQSPLGAMYSTNITPDTRDGIGSYTLEQFGNALRKGVAADGHNLYPAMPYPSFSRLSDEDVSDLYTYFEHEVLADPTENHAPDIPWPLNMRWPLSIWNALFTETQPYQPIATQTPQWNRGAYLVQGPGHCGTCHTPRGIAFQEKALDQNGAGYLSGAKLAGWYAADLAGATNSSLQDWSEGDLVEFLKAGRNTHTAAFGPMAEAVAHSTQYYNDADLNAVAVYLKSLSTGRAVATVGKDRTTANLVAGKPGSLGDELYLDNCAACHRSDGQGYQRTFPRLAGNSAVVGASPDSLIRIILHGSSMPITQAAPTGLSMPAFDWRLNDGQVAELASFLRSAWGYQAAPVTADEVARIRASP
ncbi:alcohol dehydrogenase [Pseudomonas sp. 21]|uniref:cytochrome c n=1 Tax=unclassified Pseudomonas TaxID=196821 RepID=UPI0005EB5E99|nr:MULTISPECIES: cytochrome c [unclassified Pseudomonas]KJK01094.1 alcohol dehydrogenase [Pseudomonas sp. 21]MBV7582003.1 cytochrome c [Pseudomonas sp. PDM33]